MIKYINRRSFLKYLSSGLAAIAFAPKLAFSQGKNKWPAGRPYWDMPVDSLGINNSKNLEKTLDDKINPFHQPNIIYDQLNCYGGGDYDHTIPGIDQADINAAAAGTNDYRLDVNGDQIINITDANVLQEFKDGTRSYLPGYWNFLQNRGEREAWLTKMLAIDKTDEKPYIAGDENTRWISGNYASQVGINFHGYDENAEGKTPIPTKYDKSMNGLFNMPVYFVNSVNSDTNGSHGMNAILTGDNPLNFEDWSFIEPQTDNINIQPGSQSIGNNGFLGIQKIVDFGDPYWGRDFPIVEQVVNFEINSGNVLQGDPGQNLLLSRPTVGIEDGKDYGAMRKSVLEKVYPNPTNSQANIIYNLPSRSNVSIDVYNMLGEKVNTLEKGLQEPGKHSVNWNANNQPSGIYNVILKNENQVLDTKKLVIMK